MKKRLVLFAYFLVFVSLTSNIIAGVVYSSLKVEMTEKEGKDSDNKSDIDKDKIFQPSSQALSYRVFKRPVTQHIIAKISSPALGIEINPPDFILS